MAFDITKNLAAQVFPKVEMPEVRSPVRVERPQKAGDPLRSFQDELTSEPAKTAEAAKKPVSQAADTVRQKTESAARPDQAKLPAALRTPLEQSSSSDKNPLKQFGSEQQNEILSSPAAAILAGQMQSVSPQDLPALVGQNQFLSDALFGADSSAVMEQVGDAATVLESLGVSGDLIAGLKAEYGEDLPQVSAAQVFAAAGIDPAQMLAQLNALRNQFVPQMDPASLVGDQLVAGAEELTQSAVPQNAADVQGNAAGMLRSGFAAAGLKEFESDGLKKDASSVDFGGPVPGAASALWSAASGVTTAAAGAETSDSVTTGVVGENPVSRFSEFKSWRDAVKEISAETGEMPAAMPRAFEGVSAVPQGRKASFDAFHELGERIEKLSPEQVTKVDMSQAGTEAAPETKVAVPKFMEAMINRFGMAGQNPAKATPGMPTDSMAPPVAADAAGQLIAAEGNGEDKSVMINGKPEYLVKGMQANVQQGAALADNQGVKAMFDAAPRKFTVDELMADVTAGRMNLDFVKSDAESFSQSEGGGLSQFAGQQFSGQAVSGLEKPQAFGTDFAAMLTETQQSAHVGMTTAERADMAQKVLDNATFLMRQGSGSVRLDLSNANIGPLEVAINLADNKVDIKVFTESDPVREAMIADLGRLKDALQTQNVNLNNVEVGVGQRFGGSASSDQNKQFAQQQELREAFAGNSFSPRSDAASARPEVSPVAAARRLGQMTTRVDANGQLQIRI